MCTITTTEFKNNFGKYIELGQKEEIKVVRRGQIIFTIVPEKTNMLPEDATIGIDPNERG